MMRPVLVALGCLFLLAPAVQADQNTWSVYAQSGRLTAVIGQDSSLELLQVDGVYTLLETPDYTSGWGACHAACLCPTALCPPTMQIWSGTAAHDGVSLHTEHLDSHTGTQLRVVHDWSPAGPGPLYADIIRTNVTLANDSGSTLQGVHYRRGEAFAWDDGATTVCCATMSMGSNLALQDLQGFLHGSSDMGMADPMPGSPFGQAPSGFSATCNYTPGPGPATNGTLFQHVHESDRSPCQPGGMVELDLGDLAPGAQRRFTMWHGVAANEADALHRLGPAGLHADFWFLAQSNDPAQVALGGVPFTFFWAFSGLHSDAPTCQALGCPQNPCDCPDESVPPSNPGDPAEPIPPSGPEDPAPGHNQPPIASFAYSSYLQGNAHLEFWDTSSDADGAIVAWAWDFGTGSEASGRQAGHPFPRPGRYMVRLTVWDDQGAADTATRVIPVGPLPSLDRPVTVRQHAGAAVESQIVPDTPQVCDQAKDCLAAPALPVQTAPAPPPALSGNVVPAPETPTMGPALAAGLAVGLFLLWRFLPGLVVLFSRIRRSDLMAHPTRAQLAELIEAEPGLYVSELARRAGRSRNDVMHHLEVLAKAGLVKTMDAGPLKRYFIGQKPEGAETGLRVAARRILSFAQASPGATVADLALLSGMRYGAVHYHVRALERSGLVLLKDDGQLRIFPHP